MSDKHQTKAQLLAQVAALRQQVAQLEEHRSMFGGDAARLAHEVLNTLHQHTAVVRADGVIITVNAAWDEFALKNRLRPNADLALVATSVGADYFAVCRRAVEANAPGAREALTGMLAVLNGERPAFEMEYPCDSPSESRWFLLQVLPLSPPPARHLLITHTNITARKLAEIALRESEARYRLVFETMSDFAYVVVVKPDGTRQPEWVTPATSRVVGQEPAAMLDPEAWRRLTHPDDWPIVQSQIDELLANRSATAEYRIINAAGDIRWVLDHAQPQWDDQQQRVTRLFGAVQDITARKQAEAAQRDSERRYRALFETLSEGVALNEMIYNDRGEMVDYRILEVNPAFYTTTQYDGPVVGRLATELYRLPSDIITAFWHKHKDQQTVQYSEMTSPVNNHQFWVATSPFVNGRFVTSFFDMTDRIQAEAALRESEHKFRSFIEQAAVGLSLTGEDGRIIEWNDAIAQISGVPRAAALGRCAWEIQAQLVPPERRAQYSSAVLHDMWLRFVQQCEAATTTEAPLYHPERGLRTIEETVFPIVTQRGHMLGQIVRDLTEQRRLEERYRLLFNEMQDGFVLHELICDEAGIPIDSRFLEVNPAFERMTGLHAVDVVGRTLREAVPQLLTGWIEAYGDVALTRRPRKIDGMAIPGGKYYSATAFSPQLGQFAVIFQDITERKQAERKLHLQGAALEAAANGIIITDRQGDIEWANKAFLDLTGYTLTEVIGRNPRDLIRSGKQNREFYRVLWDTITGGQVWRGEIVNRRKDGRLFVEETAITPVRLNSDGPITHFIAIKQDITARKQVDLALRQYAERLQTLHEIDRGVAVAQSPRETAQTALQHLHRLVPGDQVSVMLFDRTAQQMVVLAAFRDQPVQELNGVRFPVSESALDPLLRNQLVLVNDTTEDTAPTSGPLSRNLLANGVRSYITAPLIVESQLIGVLNVSALKPQTFEQDHLDIVRELSLQLAIAIHQARLREQIQHHTVELEERVARRTRQLAEANARLQDLDSLKSKFVSEVSHELRTPVTSLTLYLSLLERGKSDKYAHYLSQANQQAARMKQLIEDILDLSRLERDKSDLTLTPIDLNAVLEQAVVAQLPRATAAGLNVTVDLRAALPAARGDINRLLQVATNLIANAINYTPAGEVRLRSFQQPDRVGFEVQDTGMGIAPEDLPHLFQRFYRGQRASQSSVRGTGLGLSIVKEIIDWHGGEVEVHSEVGVGSTFTVWLPMAA